MTTTTEALVRELQLGELSAPCLCLDLDIAEPIPALTAPELGTPRCAWILVRLASEPLGTMTIEIPREGLDADALAVGIRSRFATSIEQRRPTIESAGAASRIDAAEPAAAEGGYPEITVVVCTRNRPDGLTACLESLLVQDYPNYSVLVVDNAPVAGGSRAVVDRFDRSIVGYVAEPEPGLSRARNRGLAASSGEIIAWIDDDEIADRGWLTAIVDGFRREPGASAVSGIMLPAELETWAQVRFEQYGGHSKHRGFKPETFSPETAAIQDPLYPLPPFGTGGNMAFRRRALLEVGGFDIALGAGSPTMGSEDTRIFSELLNAGATVVYQPTAVTFHFHRRTIDELERQMFGYGVGLTAFYVSLIVSQPRLVGKIIRLIPHALHDVWKPNGLRSGHLPEDFPARLQQANRRGLLVGPGRYLSERIRIGRTRRSSVPSGG